ncbi:hypothetical protein [Pelosinus sp. UFO1]|uniref:hypothetical protein n=1 Tax=Pelosinus sp. UFO1 TaxID=484770 RepID=UPI0004D13AAB|nr:hypothetical protein [Pelosinus sp. UFO1]AIF50717.1 hypothetical protein UFO1_1162 [Pelosinus sp. UFO1]
MEGENLVSVHNQYDIFLASPISSFGSASQYIDDRYNTLQLIGILEDKVGTVFYAGRNLPDKENLDGDQEVTKDFEAIRNCDYFIMCYPEKSTSSVLVEAGYALALDKFSIYIVRDLSDLPFLLQFAIRSFKNVLAYESESIEESAVFIEREIFLNRESSGNRPPYRDKIMK